MICAVCRSEQGVHQQGEAFHNTDLLVHCPRCGLYHTTYEAQHVLWEGKPSNAQRATISAFLRETPGYRFHSKMVRQLLAMRVPSVPEKGDRLLSHLAELYPTPGQSFTLQCDDAEIQARARAWDTTEVEYLGKDFLAEAMGYLALAGPDHLLNHGLRVKIAPKGWVRVGELRQKPIDSIQGFIAMWFRPSMDVVRDNALMPAVRDAGYEPRVINLHEHANRIDDEIVAQIRRSRFLVADFTGGRGGVYFEAGFALGLGLPVIWTCKQATLERGKLHFDVAHFNFLPWVEGEQGCAEFRRKLQLRIEAVVGGGPLATRP